MKIAIIGTASNWVDAPFKDSSWEKWFVVSGCYPHIPSFNRIYELHDVEVMRDYCEIKDGYRDFFKSIGDKFIVQDNSNYPDARVFDFKKFVKKHGRSPFSSSVSWVLAEAIEEMDACNDDEKIIGLWGINMTTGTEYESQRPGAREMIGWAKARGIKVGCHQGSELMHNSYLYAFEKEPEYISVIEQRKKLMNERKELNRKALEDAKADDYRFEGYIEALNYMQRIKNA